MYQFVLRSLQLNSHKSFHPQIDRRVGMFLILFLNFFITCAPHSAQPEKKSVDFIESSLFDGISFGSWKPTAFDYAGEIEIADSAIILHRGGYLTGITWNGPLVRMNYEFDLDAKRIEGHDFFCGITFPFAGTHASLILGGWGGYTTGISSINGIDASENGTADAIMFKENTWYHVRLRITSNHIQAWVDETNIVDLDTTEKAISLRSDVDVTTPLSILTFNTTGAVKNIVLKKL